MGFALEERRAERARLASPAGVGDYFRTVSAGFYDVAGDLAGGVGFTASLFDTPLGRDLQYAADSTSKFFNNIGEDIRSQNSESAQRTFSAAFGSPEFWDHPFDWVALHTAATAPTMTAGLVGAYVATPTIAALINEGFAGAQSMGSVYNQINKEIDGMDLSRNPIYLQLRQSGLSDAEAKREFKKLANGAKPAILFALTSIMGKYTPAGQVISKLTPKPGSVNAPIAQRIGVSALLSGGEEAIQNTAEELAGQAGQVETGLQEYYDTGALAEAAASGAVVGAVMGGGAGIQSQRGATQPVATGGAGASTTTSRSLPPPLPPAPGPGAVSIESLDPEAAAAGVTAPTPVAATGAPADITAAIRASTRRPPAPSGPEAPAAGPRFTPPMPPEPGAAAAAGASAVQPPIAGTPAGGQAPAATTAAASGAAPATAAATRKLGLADDENYKQAKALIDQTGNASTSFLQRKLGLPYGQVVRLMTELERQGVIQKSTKPGRLYEPRQPATPPAAESWVTDPAIRADKTRLDIFGNVIDEEGNVVGHSAGMNAADVAYAKERGGTPNKRPGAGTTASVQLMMTRKMRSQLQGLGYTPEEIGQMVPQEAADLIASGAAKAPVAEAPAPPVAEVSDIAEETEQAPAEMSEMEARLRGSGFSENVIRDMLAREGITPAGVTLKVSEGEEEPEAKPAKKPRKKPAAKEEPEEEAEPTPPPAPLSAEDFEGAELTPAGKPKRARGKKKGPAPPPEMMIPPSAEDFEEEAEAEPEPEPEPREKKGRKKGEKPAEEPELEAEPEPEPEPKEAVERPEREPTPDEIRADIEERVEEDVAEAGIKGRSSKFADERRRFYEAEYEKQGYDTSARGPRVLEALVDLTTPEGVTRGAIIQEWAEKNAEIKRNAAAIGEKELFALAQEENEEVDEILRASGAQETYDRKQSRQRKSYWHGVDRRNALSTEIFVRHAMIPQKNQQPLGDGSKADAFWKEFRARLDGIIADMKRTQQLGKVAFGTKVTVATHGPQGWLLRAKSIRAHMADNKRPVTEAVAFLAGEATNRNQLLQGKPLTNVWLEMSQAMAGAPVPVAFDGEGKPINPTDLILAEDRDWEDIWEDLSNTHLDPANDPGNLHAMEIASIRRNMVRPTPTVIDKMNRAKIYSEMPTVSLPLGTQMAREIYDEMRAHGGLNLKSGVSFAERGFTPGMKAAAQALRTHYYLTERNRLLKETTTPAELLSFKKLTKAQQAAREQGFKDANKAFMDIMRAKAKQNLSKRSQLKALDEAAAAEKKRRADLKAITRVPPRQKVREPNIVDRKRRQAYQAVQAEKARSAAAAAEEIADKEAQDRQQIERKVAARKKPLVPQVGQKLPQKVLNALKKQRDPDAFKRIPKWAKKDLVVDPTDDTPTLTPSQRKLLQQENDALTAMTRALPVQAPRRAISSRMRRMQSMHTATVEEEDLADLTPQERAFAEGEAKAAKVVSTVGGIRSSAGMNQFEEGDADAVESIVLGDVTEDNFTTMEQLEALIAEKVAKEERAMTREDKAAARAEREAAERAAEQAAEKPLAKKGPKIDPEEYKRQVAKGAAGGWLKSPYVQHQKVYARILQNTTVSGMLEQIDFSAAAKGVPGRASAMKYLRDRLIESVGDLKMYVVSDSDFGNFMGDEFDAVGNEAYDGIIVWFKETAEGKNENYILINDDLFGHEDKRVAESVLHEIVHAATVRGIDRDPRLRDYLNTLIDEVMAFHGIKSRKEHYGLGDALEFVAEAMTNPKFQQLLAGTPLSKKLARQLGIKKGIFATGWDAFLKFVSKSIPVPEDALSVLHALVSVTERLAADPTGATNITGEQVMKPAAKRGPRTPTVPPVRPKTVKEVAKLGRDTVADYVSGAGLRPSQRVPWLLSLADATQTMRTADRFWGTVTNPDPNNPVRKIVKVLNTIAKRTNEYMRDGEALVTRLYRAARATKPAEWLNFAEFMTDETMANVFAHISIANQPHLGKDPVNKPTLAGAQAIAKHAELAERWEALSPELKELRTAMHEFFAKRHEQMAKLVIGNILAEGARKVGGSAEAMFDAALVDRIYRKKPTEADKKKIGTVLLTQLYKARELYAARGPYIPLIRRGKYVFVATLKVKPPAKGLGGKLMADTDDTYEFRGKNGRDHAIAYAQSLDEHAWVSGVTIDEKTNESWEEMDDGSEMPGSRKKITMKDVDAIRVFRVKVQNKHVEFHDSMRRARAEAALVAQDPDVLRISTEPQLRKQGPGDRGVDFLSSDVNNLLTTLEKRTSFKQLNKTMQNELRKTITDFSLQMMSSTRVHKRRQTRKYVGGASLDIVRNLMDYRRSTSSYMARLEHARELNDGMRELDASINDPELNKEGAAGRQALAQQMQWRVEKGSVFLGDMASSPTLQRLLTTSFISRLASPMYTIMNLLQVPMIAWPVLAARHKAGRTTAAMTQAMKDLGVGAVLKTGWKETIRKAKDPASEVADYIGDLKARLRAAGHNHEADLMDSVQLQGVLESDKFERSVSTRGGFATEAGARLDTMLNYMEGFSTQMPTAAEVANRSLVLVTAYRLELELNGGDVEAAKRYAEDTNNMVNFTYSEVNTPPWLNHPLAKIPFQFKRFGHGAYQLIGQQIGRAIRNEGGGRKEALKSLAYLAAAHVLMAGTLGLPTEPVKGLLLGLYTVGLTDFNWQDVENAQRELAADMLGPDLGEVLTRGITRPFGFDISSRVGLADMFLAREPNSGDPEETMHWLEDMAFGSIGAIALDWYSGTRDAVDGDWSTALPKLVPIKFGKDLIKAFDIGATGKETTSGRPTFDPYSLPEALFRVIGATPSREAEDQEFKSYFYSERDARTRKRNDIQQRYAEGSTADRIKMRGEIERFNKGKPTEAQLNTKKLNEYIARRKTEMTKMEGGVTVNQTNRDIVRGGLDVYNTGRP